MKDDDALKVIIALGDVHRFEIFRKLMDKPGTAAGDLIWGRAPSTISHHLKILEAAGVVSSERRGRQICYSLRQETLSSFAEWTQEMAETPIFARMADFLACTPV